MAIQSNVKTLFGENRDLYIRLNSIESNNHDTDSYALFRGYLSKEVFEDGGNFCWEYSVAFKADVTQSLWPQAYQALSAVLGTTAEEV